MVPECEDRWEPGYEFLISASCGVVWHDVLGHSRSPPGNQSSLLLCGSLAAR